MKIYVGNMSLETSAEQLRTMFEPHGTVRSARLALDRETGRPRGFGFVEMEDVQAGTAITALNGTGPEGRPLKVKEAKAKENPPAAAKE